MSQLVVLPERQWYLPGMGQTLRNTQTVFILGDATGGTGYKFDRRGILTKLSVQGNVTGITGISGTWTFVVGVYSGGIAAGNKVFELSFSGSVAADAPFASTDTTPDGGGPGVGYGTGTNLFIKCVSSLGGWTAMSIAYSLVLEGVHVA